mmetsp:Transcript_29003/g.27977  ORF Transcript_29003/g.27977 Transcript_29003/m.27977 type:complete len:104 (+) Transcript_29003:829-1140(+)
MTPEMKMVVETVLEWIQNIFNNFQQLENGLSLNSVFSVSSQEAVSLLVLKHLNEYENLSHDLGRKISLEESKISDFEPVRKLSSDDDIFQISSSLQEENEKSF